MLLRNQHAEEAVLLDEIPDLFGDLAQAMAHLPVVDHRAQLMRRAVEEGLLLGRELDRRDRLQLVPVGRSGKYFGVEADRAGLQRLRFGIGNLRQDRPDLVEYRRHDQAAPQRRDRKQRQRDERQPRNPRQNAVPRSFGTIQRSGLSEKRQQANRHGPGPHRRSRHAEGQKCADNQQQKNYGRHFRASFGGLRSNAR